MNGLTVPRKAITETKSNGWSLFSSNRVSRTKPCPADATWWEKKGKSHPTDSEAIQSEFRSRDAEDEGATGVAQAPAAAPQREGRR